MLTEYIAKQMSRARYKKLEDGIYFGYIPSLRGVWGSAKTLSNCKKDLREVLEGWIVIRLGRGMSIPSLVRGSRRVSFKKLSSTMA